MAKGKLSPAHNPPPNQSPCNPCESPWLNPEPTSASVRFVQLSTWYLQVLMGQSRSRSQQLSPLMGAVPGTMMTPVVALEGGEVVEVLEDGEEGVAVEGEALPTPTLGALPVLPGWAGLEAAPGREGMVPAQGKATAYHCLLEAQDNLALGRKGSQGSEGGRSERERGWYLLPFLALPW